MMNDFTLLFISQMNNVGFEKRKLRFIEKELLPMFEEMLRITSWMKRLLAGDLQNTIARDTDRTFDSSL